MIKKSIAAVGVALMLHGYAQAADSGSGSGSCSGSGSSQSEHSGTWAAEGQLGIIMTSGNTTTKSGNASFDVAHRMGRWTVSGGVRGLYASTSHYTTQQDTSAHLQGDLDLSPRTFWFSSARWDRNLFTGFSYQASVASGGGFKFVQSNSTLLAAELGAGYRVENPELLTIGPFGNVQSRTHVPGSMQRNAVMQAGVNYSHSITHLTKIVNTLLVQYGSNDTTTTDNLSVQVKIDSTLALAVGAQLINNTNPPAAVIVNPALDSVRHTSTVFTVNLVYNLKNSKLSPTAGTPVAVNGFNLP